MNDKREEFHRRLEEGELDVQEIRQYCQYPDIREWCQKNGKYIHDVLRRPAINKALAESNSRSVQCDFQISLCILKMIRQGIETLNEHDCEYLYGSKSKLRTFTT